MAEELKKLRKRRMLLSIVSEALEWGVAAAVGALLTGFYLSMNDTTQGYAHMIGAAFLLCGGIAGWVKFRLKDRDETAQKELIEATAEATVLVILKNKGLI